MSSFAKEHTTVDFAFGLRLGNGGRELDRLELLLKQIKAVEAERDLLLAAQQVAAPPTMRPTGQRKAKITLRQEARVIHKSWEG